MQKNIKNKIILERPVIKDMQIHVGGVAMKKRAILTANLVQSCATHTGVTARAMITASVATHITENAVSLVSSVYI